ncbi:MAG TPA: lipopolysaccharide biosynthesis protein, partial [Solirubrobacteraceae bacterium]|nr:lipopolysaccharide biosynthesis protein [Solirubrobacteraceae bacterium]
GCCWRLAARSPAPWLRARRRAEVFGYLKRLVTAGAAYQAGDILSKGAALVTLPLYTRYVAKTQYGYAEALLTAVILASIILRLGIGEAFIRFYYDDEDTERRDRIAAGAVALSFVTTTIAALAGVALAGPLSRAMLGAHTKALFEIAMLGIWAFTNLEIAYALLRADERKRTYMKASIADVSLTIPLMVYLVVFRHDQARGLLAGNYVASSLILLGLWWNERHRLLDGLRRARPGAPPLALRRLLHFGLPTVPADASVYALQVADRWYLVRDYSPAAAGVYAIAAKLATVVFVAVRGFQYAWPPLAYSVEDDEEAARLYALVTTYYVLATGAVVAGVALFSRWGVRILYHTYFNAYKAIPWLALGWALYGLYLIFIVISGRARRTRLNVPAAFAGLAVNVACLFLLVPPLGIAGAGIALAIGYTAMIIVIYLLTRSLFAIDFEWGRLARLVVVFVVVSVGGDLFFPTHGLAGFLLRALAWLLIFPLLRASGFFTQAERARAGALAATILHRRRRT